MPPRFSLWSIPEELWWKPTFENPPENTVLIILYLWNCWEAGSRRVHLSPGSGNIPDVTRCTATQAHYEETAYLWSPLFSPHLWPMGLFFGNILEEWRAKNLNPSVSPQNFLANFLNNHSKTKGKSAFLKPTFHLCPPENHPEGKSLVCYLYSHILSSLLTWCVSQQPLKCTYLTPSLHFKAPHPWLPNTSVANLT